MDAEQRRLELVASLRYYLTRFPDSEFQITHSLGLGLTAPPLINGRQPDLLARGLGRKLIIGLVKTAAEISDKQSIRQYQAFGSYADPETGEGAVLNLIVPKGLKDEAQATLEAAGLAPQQFNVIGSAVDSPKS